MESWEEQAQQSFSIPIKKHVFNPAAICFVPKSPEGAMSDAPSPVEEIIQPQSKRSDQDYVPLATTKSDDTSVAPSPVSEAKCSELDTITDSAEESLTAAEKGPKPPKNAKDPDPRPHLNIVFIGHVDAGKSTTCGNILVLTGEVDQRRFEKYEREAKEKNRESWFLAFVMDIYEEERAKGKTQEVGRATFELENTRFTILDAPGHKSFVPAMIAGAAQADVGVLIISARKGEFETGFEKGGQTREHAMLAKTLGVSKLVVAINKMDDPTCKWSQERYDEICTKLVPFFRATGYNSNDVCYIPISGLTGANLREHISYPQSKCYLKEAEWYSTDKPTLFELLDNLSPPVRSDSDPLRVPLLDGYKDQAVVAVGKVEAGTLRANSTHFIVPARQKVKVIGISLDVKEEEVTEVRYAKPGENVTIRLTGIEETQITKGSVLCSIDQPVKMCSLIKAQVMIVELLEKRPILTAGYQCIIHAHTACEEVEIETLIDATDRASKKKKNNPQFVKANTMVTCNLRLLTAVALEEFSVRPQLGRFTLRDEMKTIAVGKVLEILE